MPFRQLDDRELSTVLAALRVYQAIATKGIIPAVVDIATDGGTLTPLSIDEIDDLCDQINTGATQ